jgi:hypothetical protein
MGAYAIDADLRGKLVPSRTPQRLDFAEESLGLDCHQLLGRHWALHAGYRITRSELKSEYTAFTGDTFLNEGIQWRQRTRGLLQRVDLSLRYNSVSGLFGEAQGRWWSQANRLDGAETPGADFWQANLFGGWRSPQRKVEATLGVLNLGGRDYRLSPINYLVEPARARTLVLRLRLAI